MVGQCGIRMYDQQKKRIVDTLSQNPSTAEAYRQLSSEPMEIATEDAELLSRFGLVTIIEGKGVTLNRRGGAVRSTILEEVNKR